MMTSQGPSTGKQGRRGSTILEFVLAGSFILLPLLAGTASVGMSMLRAMQVVALNRDIGHMFATGLDFSQAANRNLVLKLAGGLNITNSGGHGVIILSEIDGTGNNQAVCSHRVVIGNAALRASSYVSPASNVIDSAGNVTNPGDASASVNANFLAIMPMAQGEVAYVAESWFSTSDYDWTGFFTGTGIYTKAVF